MSHFKEKRCPNARDVKVSMMYFLLAFWLQTRSFSQSTENHQKKTAE